MKTILSCIAVLVFNSQIALGDANKTIQFNAVVSSRYLDACDIKSISKQRNKKNYYIAIKLTKSGMEKANKFYNENIGKKLILTFQDDVLVNDKLIAHPGAMGTLLIEATNKQLADRIVNAMQKVVSKCKTGSI